MTETSLNGDVMIYSNSPVSPTGYGRQMNQLVRQLTKHGARVAVSANHGQDDGIGKFETDHGIVDIYPKSYTGYSIDTIARNYQHFTNKSNAPKMLLTLYDTWVMNGYQSLDEFEIHSWTPVDHLFLVPKVAQWIAKDNVKPIAMSIDGQEQMKAQGKMQVDMAKLQLDAQKQQSDQLIKLQEMAMKDDLSRDEMVQDLAIKVAEILGKYDATVDTAAIKAAQDAPRSPNTEMMGDYGL